MTGSRELSLLRRGPERHRPLRALLGVRLLLLAAAAAAAVGFALVGWLRLHDDVGMALAGAGAALVGAQSTPTLPLVVELPMACLPLTRF